MAYINARAGNMKALRLGKLEISASALVLPAVIYFLNAEYILLLTAIAVAAHELGHYAALKLCSGRLERLSLWLGGVSMQYGGLGYHGETITALAGPLMSLALALVSSFCGRLFGIQAAYHLAGLSLLLALFNMLPLFPLDGGRALYAVLALKAGIDAAERVRRALTIILCVLFLLGGAALFVLAANPTLLIAGAWLVCGAVRNAK